MKMNLTKEDIRKINYEKRSGFVFSGFVIATCMLLNFVYFIVQEEVDWTLFYGINSAILIISVIIVFLINRKYRRDLNEGIRILRKGIIEKKENSISYEVGSGSIEIPLLGSLFPKIWGQKMGSSDKYIFIISGIPYETDKDLFNRVQEGDSIKMYYTKFSEILLELQDG